MASSRTVINKAIQVVLALVILGLAYVLYISITGPWEGVRKERELRERTRERMANVRTAMIRYEAAEGRFVTDLDSLVAWLQEDTTVVRDPAGVFRTRPGRPFYLDSLPYSPRTGNRFELLVNDTSRVNIYLLRDPDSEDYIGAVEPDVTRLNAASWE